MRKKKNQQNKIIISYRIESNPVLRLNLTMCFFCSRKKMKLVLKLEKRLFVATVRLVWRTKEGDRMIKGREHNVIYAFLNSPFFDCKFLHKHTHTLFVYLRKVAHENTFFFLQGDSCFGFGFVFILFWEQILSQAMSAHTCFLRK